MAIQQAQNKGVIQKTPEDVGSSQVNFNADNFNDVIFDKGYKCHIDRALKCPCKNKVSGSAESACKNCQGTGWVFINRIESVIQCTSMSNKSKYENWTEANMGMVNITCRPKDKLGFMDKVTLLELESWFSEVLELQEDSTDNTKMFSFLIYKPIYVFDIYLYVDSETQLRSLNSEEFTVIDNVLKINKSLSQGFDLIKPKITVRYTHNPTYHIIDINRDLIKQKAAIMNCNSNIVGDKVDLPLNCIGRKAHYILDAPDLSGVGVFDNTDYNKNPLVT